MVDRKENLRKNRSHTFGVKPYALPWPRLLQPDEKNLLPAALAAAALLEKRRAINDPLLDPAILEQFRNEVGPMTNRQRAREHRWRYPEYFFPNRQNR